jgi:hypothetical protein
VFSIWGYKVMDFRESLLRVRAYESVWQALCLTVLGVMLLLIAPTAAAQGYGRITGIVTDPAGAAVQGAKVTVTQVATGETTITTTGSEGAYIFPSLRPAEYNLSATSAGFGTFLQNGVTLQADAAVTVNISLKVGKASDIITVEGNVTNVDTSSATLSQVVDERRINDLPLNGRNAASLTTLVAGVVIAPNAQADQGLTKTFPVAVTITANGTRVGQTTYLLDGGNNVDEYTNVNAPFPFPDALQEFSVQTSNYNAEYGQNAGGVVNIVTKSGGNSLHGDVFEYVRNGYFNAPNYFSPGKAVDPLKRNQFGGTVGGPIKLPGISTPHSFFFGGYQRTVVRNNPLSNSAAFVPTAAQLNGIFSSCITNPFTKVPYPCVGGVSTVNPADYSASSLALLNHLPKGDATGAIFFFKPTRQNLDEALGRFDQDIGTKDKLNVHYFYDRFFNGAVNDPANLLTYSDQATIKYQNVLFSETHVFSDRLLNNFIVNYQRDNAARGPVPVAGGISVADLGVNIWQPTLKQINQIQVTGSKGFTIGDNPAATFHRINYTASDDLHIVRGTHDLAFGFHGELSRVDLNNLFRQPGTFQFTGANVGDPVAAFLLGYVNNFQQASGQYYNTRGKFFGFYGQDSWKVNRRLTLSYGLRYEPFFPWHEAKNRMGAFSPTAFTAGTHSTAFPNAPVGLLFPGDPGMLRDGIRKVYTDFEPRVGFAWDVRGDGKTSVRGGGGIFYDTRLSSVFNNIYSNGSPFVTQVNLTPAPGNFSNPYGNTVNPFPAPQPPPSTAPFPTQTFLTFDPYHEYQVPRIYNWNLAVERQLTGSSLFRIAYVGSRGNHLWLPLELNPSVYNPATDTATRVYAPVYSQPITAAVYSGNTNYNSLQGTFEERLRRGMTLLVNYTWSKALDNLPWNAAVTAIGANNSFVFPTYEPNPTRLDYGLSDFDHRHVLSISYVWELPKVSNGWGPLRYILNDWQANGIIQYRSGDPLTLFSSNNNISQTAQARDRAVYLGGNPYSSQACSGVVGTCVGFLNPGAFRSLNGRTKDSKGNIISYGDGPSPSNPDPALRFGNVGKGFVIGPQYADWDASLMRHFNFTERWKAEFRGEFFNLLNHPNFGDPATTPGGGFGRITGAQDPRIGQLSFKLLF